MRSEIAKLEADPSRTEDWYAGVPRSGRLTTIIGFAILLVGVAGFGTWAGTAPIEGAVVSPGVFVATSQNKVVQHLEGGVIRDILVEEGDRVEAGDVLIRLDDTEARANLRRLMSREAQLMATEARLTAEADEDEVIIWPERFAARRGERDVEIFIAAEDRAFETRRNRLRSELEINERALAALQHDLVGHEARLESARRQAEMLETELVGQRQLYNEGLSRSREYFSLERTYANMQGEIGRLTARIADSEERIAGAREELRRARRIAVAEAVENRNAVRSELMDIRERITAQRSVIGRIEIAAPVEGVVVSMNYHTAGGVIRPGADILALLPSEDDLVIEARVRPQDIDNLRDGQRAMVRLSALNQRVTPMIEGRVIYVSADALPDDQQPASGDNIYVVRVEMDQQDVAEVDGFLATPGMPAEVFIRTGERTFFEYLMQPVYDTMARAFRES